MRQHSFADVPPVADAFSAQVADTAARVVANDWVNAEYKLIVLDAPGLAATAEAGQFFNIECPVVGEDKPFFRRPMSTYAADSVSGRVAFLYKVAGAGTRGLAALEAGETTRILGPLGVGFTLPEDIGSIVVLGRGVGLATLAPLAEMARERGVAVTAIVSARGPEQVLSVERFRNAGAQVEIVLDSDGTSDIANVEAILRRLHAEGRADGFYTCGSNRLMLLMQNLAAELGIYGEVAMEQQMACGLGMCFCCVRNFNVEGEIVSKRVCWDGPVFPLAEATSW
ncbi:dihydroorotate dehydrogenase electron transfer subunit [Pelagibacterium sp. 26DY04]|uniref:dihydroorotate dehydrogenase electron transfer subunit n=1 Tax=Pelagibacterium sp. 26DY04 TaxID=2967130 RepID=UPI002814BDEF|nr:dihydroorotate dehydrogenase electron transfer subunit [Pelagibacterium sp. 26DY04]WMT88463.1 dihydroorotate dehydrogenase electron transfer subunit [Pelagibacterium sp. 26DY04]